MHLKKLSLKNFRNYSSQQLSFIPELNFLYGQNAQGKTNILEAIFFLCTTQTPRTNKVAELVSWGEKSAFIEGEFENKQGKTRVAFELKRNGEKTISIDQKYLARTSELLGLFPVIFFSPEDLEVIKKAPQGRRRFLDLLLSQTSKQYAFQLIQYNKILKQRNECLKLVGERKTPEGSLAVWDEALVNSGLKVTELRKKGLSQIIPLAGSLHGEITEGKESLKIDYLSSMGANKEEALQKIKKYRRNEIITQKTCLGPHRDDLLIFINEREAKNFASHGQQRTAIISLKMAEINYMEEIFGERPIVLLDDILLELDSQRFEVLLKKLFQDTQAIMSGTETHRFKKALEMKVQLYEVENGNVQEPNEVLSAQGDNK